MALSPEMTQKIAELRQKAREGTITLEETKEALSLLRADRTNAQATSTTSRSKKAPKAPVNADDLLSELEGL